MSLNKCLKEDLSSYAVSHVPEQKMIIGYDNNKWYQFQKLTYGTFSGNIHKYKTLELVITDVKWNILHELSKCITTLGFQSQSINAPNACSILTNVDGNTNEGFWRSVDIDPRFCDFCNDMSACIAWRNINNNSPFFLYSNVKNRADIHSKNDILHYYISNELCSYLIASHVDTSIRNKLAKYSCDISKLKKKSIRYWLKSKVRINTKMFYEARFMNEYKYTIREGDFDNFSSLVPNKKPLILRLYSTMEKQLEDTKKFYNDIFNLYQSNMDYRNAKTNYKIQILALVSSIISTFVAIVAIVISIMSNESAIKVIKSWLN